MSIPNRFKLIEQFKIKQFEIDLNSNFRICFCFPATVLSSFCSDYTSLAVYSATFGITIGAYVTLNSLVLVDLFGLEQMTNAFGLLLLFQGIASLIGPPIAGLIHLLIQFNSIPFNFISY